MNFFEQTQQKLKNKIILLSAIWLFALTTVYSFAVLPLLSYMQNDILLDGTVIYTALEWLYPLLEVILLALSYGFSIYGIYRFGFREALPIMAIPVAASVYKYASNLIMSYVMSKEPISIDYVYSIFYVLMEVLLLVIVVAIANKYISIQKEIFEIRAKGLKYLGKEDDTKPMLPFLKVLDMNNPLQKSMLIVSIVMAAIRVAQRIRLDIYIGLPHGTKEIFTMVIYYISDVLVMPIAYVVMSLTVMGCFSMYLKHLKKSKEDAE